MAVTSVQSGLGGQASASGDQSDGRRGAVRTFSVLVDDPANDSEVSVRSSSSVPQPGNVHPDDPFMVVRSVQLRRVSPFLYQGSADYRAVGVLQNQAPTENRLRWRSGGSKTQEAIDVDVNGAPILTVVGESYDPPVQRQFTDQVLTITWDQVGDVDLQQERNYFDRVNSGVFGPLPGSSTVYPAGTLLVDDIATDGPRLENEQYITTRTVTLRARKAKPGTGVAQSEVWRYRQRAEGFLVQDPAAPAIGPNQPPTPIPAMAGGAPVVRPVLHDTTTGEEITNPAQAQFYLWEIFESADFNQLIPL